mmetsp:Transcript_57723/g.160906  ORF Transcript_57723/g.160906 Transcript_57723/m.160906 type:complete len:282 (-) Transcript_57723:220-1065(-)
MVGRSGHAIPFRVFQEGLGILQVLLRYLEFAHGLGLGLCRLLHHPLGDADVLVVNLELVLERLPHEFEVVLRVHFLSPHVLELGHRLLLQILKHVGDAFAARFVNLWHRRPECVVVIVLLVAALHEPKQFLLVVDGQCGRVDYGAERADYLPDVSPAHLRLQHRGAMHPPLQNVNGSLEGIDGVVELLLRCDELLELFLADRRRGLQVGVVGRNRGPQILNLRAERHNIRLGLLDRGSKILDACFRGLDFVLLFLRAILAPVDVRNIRLLLSFAVLDDFGF